MARPNAARPPAPRRLLIIVVLVMSLLLTLAARLYYVQVVDRNKPEQTADRLHLGSVVVPAPRGLILDSQGKPLVGDTSVEQITVDRDELLKQPDRGATVLRGLAGLLKTPATQLGKEITPCSPTVGAPCWTGEPYAPVPVATNAPTSVVLAISEHRERYPGVAVQAVSLPSYPNGSLAAQVLGYTSQPTEADLKANPKLDDADSVGVSGLEQQYDDVLRGIDGKQLVQLNPQGYPVGATTQVPAQQGDSLVTSIDSNIQALAEKALAQQIQASHKQGYKAPSGSVVVMDPNTGRIIAAASYPTYDPQMFVGGISASDYAKLTAPAANTPLLNRATAGEYAPGSTFKLITSSSDYMHHELNLTDTYPCPGSLTINGQVKTNYDSEVLGPVTLENALGYSCDTFFYAPAVREFNADQQRVNDGKKPHEYLQAMARAYGVGTDPGVDLPAGEQASGGYASREINLALWKQNKATWCAQAKSGYTDVADATNRAYLTKLASENCTDGWRYNAGENADMAIGQGATTMSPLQLAVAYSAMLNGGKIYEPTFGWAVVNNDGKVVKTIKPTVRNTVPVSQKLFNYFAKSLSFSRGWPVSGAFAYLQSSYRNQIGGKTGTAEVYGKQDTSWLASWGPTYKQDGNAKARFVIVGMVEQAGTGAKAAGPMIKQIWDGIMGAGGKKPIVPASRPIATLPDVRPQTDTSGPP